MLAKAGSNQRPTLYLEGQAQVVAVGIHRFLLLFGHAAEHCAAPAAGSNEAGSFVERLVQVLLQSDLSVKEAACLADFPVGKVCNDLGNEFDNLQATQNPWFQQCKDRPHPHWKLQGQQTCHNLG